MLTENGRLKMPSILAELLRKTTAESEDKQEHENWRRSEGTEGGRGDRDAAEKAEKH